MKKILIAALMLAGMLFVPSGVHAQDTTRCQQSTGTASHQWFTVTFVSHSCYTEGSGAAPTVSWGHDVEIHPGPHKWKVVRDGEFPGTTENGETFNYQVQLKRCDTCKISSVLFKGVASGYTISIVDAPSNNVSRHVATEVVSESCPSTGCP